MTEKIETILDYNPTDEEWKRFGGKESFMRWFDIYIKSSPDNFNYHLGLLFSIREDKEKASMNNRATSLNIFEHLATTEHQKGRSFYFSPSSLYISVSLPMNSRILFTASSG